MHRDLKPANLFLAHDADGVVVKVLDFGIARSTEPQGVALTHSMQTLGTPHYMSPEQVRSAKEVDARSDLYAMGVILYQALAGKLPFDGPSATAIIAAIVTEEPVRLASLRPDIPRPISELVHRAMSRDPEQRPRDARTMRQQLLLAAQGHPLENSGAMTVVDGGAPTIPMSATPMPGLAATPGFAAAPKPRTGRRGFFAIFGVLSTLLVVGLAGSTAWMTTIGGAPDAAGGAPVLPPVTTGVPAGAVPGAAPPVPAQGIASARGGEVPLGPVSPALSLTELALRIRDLPQDLQRCARVVPVGDAWVAIAADACSASRDALVSSLSRGAPIASATLDDAVRAAALEPVMLQTTTRANVRDGASSAYALRRSLPEDALVVGLAGTIDGVRSEVAGSGTWVRAIAAEGSDGWVASGLVRTWTACVPSTASLGSARVIVATTSVASSERDSSGALLFEPEAGDGRSRVRLARMDPSCGLGETFELPRGDDPIEEVIVTRVAPEGETLVALGTRAPGPRSADGAMRWAAWRLAATEPSWGIDLHSGQTLPDARRDGIAGPILEGHGGARGFWPLRVRIARGGGRTWYVWDGTTLVPDGDAGSPTPLEAAE